MIDMNDYEHTGIPLLGELVHEIPGSYNVYQISFDIYNRKQRPETLALLQDWKVKYMAIEVAESTYFFKSDNSSTLRSHLRAIFNNPNDKCAVVYIPDVQYDRWIMPQNLYAEIKNLFDSRP